MHGSRPILDERVRIAPVNPPCLTEFLNVPEQQLEYFREQQPSRPLVRARVRVRVPGRGGGRCEPKPEILSPSGKKPDQFRDNPFPIRTASFSSGATEDLYPRS